MAFRSGFVSIIGRPNSGKSTLLNSLVGEKIAIVTHKPQTTRSNIQGMVNLPAMKGHPAGQIIFVDTPGVHKPGTSLDRHMMDQVRQALGQCDLILLLIDVTQPFGAGDKFVLDMLKRYRSQIFLVLNKIDRIAKEKLLPLKKPIEKVAQASGEIEKITTTEEEQAKPQAVVVKRSALAEAFFTQGPEFVASAVVMFILLYFLLAYDGVFLDKIIRATPRLGDKKRAVSIMRDIEAHISRYLLTITAINIGLGIAVGTTVHFLGLRNPIMWGVMVAAFNFIPYLGALTGIICMTLGAVLSFDSLGYALIFPASYLLLAILEGNFITPFVLGRSLTLNPVVILVALAFWGWMWGISGMILAVPILATFKIFCDHIEPMAPIAEFLS